MKFTLASFEVNGHTDDCGITKWSGVISSQASSGAPSGLENAI